MSEDLLGIGETKNKQSCREDKPVWLATDNTQEGDKSNSNQLLCM